MGLYRSMNADLQEGATDGKYKKVVQNRGGVVESATHEARIDLNDVWYGIHEQPVKTNQSVQHRLSPNYVPTPPAHLD